MESTPLLMMTTAAMDCQYIWWTDQFYCIEHDEHGPLGLILVTNGVIFHTPIFLNNSIGADRESSKKGLTNILDVEIAVDYGIRETPKV